MRHLHKPPAKQGPYLRKPPAKQGPMLPIPLKEVNANTRSPEEICWTTFKSRILSTRSPAYMDAHRSLHCTLQRRQLGGLRRIAADADAHRLGSCLCLNKLLFLYIEGPCLGGVLVIRARLLGVYITGAACWNL